MWNEIFTLPFFIVLVIVFIVNARVSGLKQEIKDLRNELAQTKKWLGDELYGNNELKNKLEKGE